MIVPFSAMCVRMRLEVLTGTSPSLGACVPALSMYGDTHCFSGSAARHYGGYVFLYLFLLVVGRLRRLPRDADVYRQWVGVEHKDRWNVTCEGVDFLFLRSAVSNRARMCLQPPAVKQIFLSK